MRTTLRHLRRHVGEADTLTTAALTAAGLALVALVDSTTGSELSLSLFYLGPICLFAWRTGIRGGVGASLVGATTWYLVDEAGEHVYSHPLIPVWNGLVRLGFFVIVCGLLVSLRRSVERETSLARTDPLTGLLNRRAFDELAGREIERARRVGLPLTFAYLDLDGFKGINDRLGHAAGDEMLRSVARAMDLVLRSVDAKARLGGDEFALVMPDTGVAAARQAIDRMVSVLAAAGVAASIGIVVYERPPAGVDEALAAVDAVMYEAKVSRRRGIATRVVADAPDDPAFVVDLRASANPVEPDEPSPDNPHGAWGRVS